MIFNLRELHEGHPVQVKMASLTVFFGGQRGKRFRQDINSYAEKTDSDTLNITFFLVCTY